MSLKSFNIIKNKLIFKISVTALVTIIFLLLIYLPIFKEKTPQNIKTITITAVGDCTLGKNTNIEYKNSWNHKFDTYGKEYFLKNVSSIFLNDDITIANLEGVLTSSTQKQQDYFHQRQNKNKTKKIFHLGRPEYIESLSSNGIDVVTFANNHNIDFGLEGFKETIETCHNHNLPIAYYDNVVRYKIDNLIVGIISVDSTYSSISTAKQYLKKGISDLNKDCDLIIASIHWGENYQKKISKKQKTLGHLSIDYGADLVIGHHPHILQGIERYKGRYILYSLGNFSYGGRSIPKDIDTIIAQKTFTFIGKKLQIDDNLKIIPCWISTKKEINDFQPIIKNGKDGYLIIDKLNKLSEEFGVNIDNQGIPRMPKAKNTKRIPIKQFGKKQEINKIPDIINILLKTNKT